MGSSYAARKDAIVIAGRLEASYLTFLKHHRGMGIPFASNGWQGLRSGRGLNIAASCKLPV